MHSEELLNSILHFLYMRAAARDLQEVPGPELAYIFQSTCDVVLLANRKDLDLTENSIVIQVADILLQPLLHKPEA